MDELRKKQGQRLKEVRNILGLSQAKFCNWLAKYNQLGNYQETYSYKTIQAWEQGIRKVPDHIKKVLSDNVSINGDLVQYAYLNGDTDFITQSTCAIIKKSYEILDSLTAGTEWVQASENQIQELTNSVLNRFGIVFLNEMLPIYNHSKNDFFDIVRFNKYMYEQIGKLIEDYIMDEKQGR